MRPTLLYAGLALVYCWPTCNPSFGGEHIGASFVGANLTGAAFTPPAGFDVGLGLHYVDFSNADFTGVQFNGTETRPVSFHHSNLTGVDLTLADVTHVLWEDTICPDGTNSDANGNTCVGHLAP